MTRTLAFLIILTLTLTLTTSPASAQALRTWINDATGDDFNPCNITAPCATFSGAISKTATNGEINVIAASAAGIVSITKSITIDGAESKTGVLFAAGSGMTVNASDAIVIIRNIDFNGVMLGARGINILAAASVTIENCTFSNYTAEGVRDARTVAGKLYIRNSTFVGGNYGVLLTSTVANQAVLENITVRNAAIAGARASGGGGQLHIMDSAFAGGGVGVLADNGEALVERSSFTFNTTGVDAAAGGTIRLSECAISKNTTGVAITGIVYSFGHNRIHGNTGGNGAGMTAVLEQ